MKISKTQFAGYIREFRFRELFIDLGWDNDRTVVTPLRIDGYVVTPQVVANKNGFKIIECSSPQMPPSPIRFQVSSALKKRFAEHLIIFRDDSAKEQIWLYCYTLNGLNKKSEVRYNNSQDAERLYQRAAGLIFELDEQDNITIVDVTARVRGNFGANAERVTKKFYDQFKKQHTALLGFIKGINSNVNREWYASIMLNRLMFCYFMQKRGFLNGDRDYLRNKLAESKQKLGEGQFYSFYREFLLKLFHKGFGSYERGAEIQALIGNIPYLNGGLFDLHEIEKTHPDIDIPDAAFESIFTLFDRYEWHLDARPNAAGNEINPDVLGYIFEKYINDRAAMGAYYTQEDITGYICRNTILPYLLESVKKIYPKAFEPDGLVWSFLYGSGDTYIFNSLKKGVDRPLPEHIQIGIDTTEPNLIERRIRWNEPAADEYALPTEIWREVVERRGRYNSTASLISEKKITGTADLITYNLDIISFVNDLLDSVEDPVFVRVFYENLTKITILDPTCGSGAFLFAALNILEPLYATCLRRMQDYLDHDYKGILNRSTRRYFDEQLELVESDAHPNVPYYIYKSIILNNLYGVDIMREAVETAKLRLFLKLVSAAEPNYRAENIGIEPLPDIDFNIKTGNTLIGYANEDEVKAMMLGTLEITSESLADAMNKMYQLAKVTSRYKELQLGAGDYRQDDFKAAKSELTARQAELKAVLDKELRKTYGGNVSDEQWINNYMPFHWVSEFYSIIVENGGFDVVIGNPPYVEYSKIKSTYELRNYSTLSCGNLYAYVMERICQLHNKNARLSMIVPLSGHSTERMEALIQNFYRKFSSMFVINLSADANPSTLFIGVKFRLAIFNVSNTGKGKYSTKYIRWYADERSNLFDTTNFCDISEHVSPLGVYVVPKIDNKLFMSIKEKLDLNAPFFVGRQRNSSVLYHNCPVNWIRSHTKAPFFTSEKIGDSESTQLKQLWFASEEQAKAAQSITCSTLFFIWWLIQSDCYHLNNRELRSFRLSADNIVIKELSQLSDELQEDMQKNAKRRVYVYQTTGRVEYDEFYMKKSKPIIDRIDKLLSRHYGFTEEELDYIINYDIKYRMGLNGNAAAEEEE